MTVTTFSFTYSGGIEDWVVPFHTGTIRLDVVGGYGGREQGAPGGAGGNPGTISGTATIAAGTVTGTRTTFHPDGTVDTVEQLTGLPIPPPPEPDPMADMQAQLAAQQALIDELLTALGGKDG